MSSKPLLTKGNHIFVVIFSHHLIDTLFVNCEWLVNGNNISFKSCTVLLNGIGMAQKSISLMSDLVSLLLSANRTPMQEAIVLSCHICLINAGIEKMNNP
jgi:hypothetical protein